MQPTFDKYVFRLLLALVLVMLAGGMVFYHIVEKFSWIDAYYFCVVTLTTVGYGDLTPHTDLGKIFTTFYILTGVGIITTFVTYSVRRYAGRAEKHAATKHESKKD